MIIYCRRKKPRPTLDLLFEVQTRLQNCTKKKDQAQPGIKFQDLENPGPTFYFILKTLPCPISLRTGLFEHRVVSARPLQVCSKYLPVLLYIQFMKYFSVPVNP